MSKIIFVSRTQISENGNVILYEKRYHGVLTENGSVQLKAYCAKRIPLGTVDDLANVRPTGQVIMAKCVSNAPLQVRPLKPIVCVEQQAA